MAQQKEKICKRCELFGRPSIKSIYEFPQGKSPCKSCRRDAKIAKKPKTFKDIMNTSVSAMDYYKEMANIRRSPKAKLDKIELNKFNADMRDYER